jgi:hypothetical protein
MPDGASSDRGEDDAGRCRRRYRSRYRLADMDESLRMPWSVDADTAETRAAEDKVPNQSALPNPPLAAVSYCRILRMGVGIQAAQR